MVPVTGIFMGVAVRSGAIDSVTDFFTGFVFRFIL